MEDQLTRLALKSGAAQLQGTIDHKLLPIDHKERLAFMKQEAARKLAEHFATQVSDSDAVVYEQLPNGIVYQVTAACMTADQIAALVYEAYSMGVESAKPGVS